MDRIPPSSAHSFARPLSINNEREEDLLQGGHRCGEIVHLSDGQEGAGVHLTVHGLGSSPSSMQAATEQAHAQGQSTAAFIYDDLHCGQGETADRLSDSLQGLLAQHDRLTIDSHSLGSRVVVEALDGHQGLNGKTVDHNMFNPQLDGVGIANLALPLPTEAARTIPGALPVHDMASGSAAQARLESASSPPQVNTSIYAGTEDDLTGFRHPNFQRVAQNMRADVYYVEGGGHFDTQDRVVAGAPLQTEMPPAPPSYDGPNR